MKIKTDTKTPTIVKLLHAETGEVEELEMDKYLYGVVSEEMPANFEKKKLFKGASNSCKNIYRI